MLWIPRRQLMMPIPVIAGPGSRLYTTQSTAYYSDIDDLEPDFIVDPARSTNGTGSEGSPYQPSQAFGVDPSGQRVVFEWLPGNLDFTDANANSKFSRWHPDFSGASGQPIIHRARYKASRLSAGHANLTQFRRTGGTGAILGILNTSYCWFDGFSIPTFTGAHDGNENYQFSLWGSGCTGIRFLRFRIDGEGLGNSTQSSTNAGAIWAQPSTDFEIADGFVSNVGEFGTTNDIWSGFECYDTQGLNLHHVTFENIHGFGVFLKGDPNREFLRNRVHHCLVKNVSASCYFAYQIEAGTTPLSDLNWWYHLIGIDGLQHGIQLNRAAATDHSGTIFQNFTLVGCNEAVAIRGAASTGFSPLIRLTNGVFYQNNTNIQLTNGFPWGTVGSDNIEFDYNRYSGHVTAHFNDSNGNRAFGSWQTLLGNGVTQDQNGDTSVPNFVNAAGEDYRTAAGEPQDADDYLSVLSGDLRRGAFGDIGCRTDA